MQNTNFINDGIQIYKNFIRNEDLLLLRNECENKFSISSIFGLNYFVRLNKYLKEIPYPTVKIDSINLLELAIDISNEIKDLGFKDYKCAHIALYHEEKNPNELLWHSDMRNGGLIRAQICILGSDMNSGAFRYVAQSHSIESNLITYEPTKDFIDNAVLDNKIVTCNVDNGSLAIINTIGYHSKCKCINPRISLMFDFLPASYIINNKDDVASNIFLSSSKISLKVLNNIHLFINGVDDGSRSPNTPDFYKLRKPFLGCNFSDFLKSILLLLRRK